MKEKSLAVKILLYSIPLAATGILQQLFNAADVAVVGRFAGTEAMAAVGANTPIVGLIVTSFVGLSLGTSVVIATAIGAEDRHKTSKAVHTSIILSLVCGIVMCVVGELFSLNILRSLSVPDNVLKMAELYLRVYLAGMPVIMLYNFEASIFRGAGNTRTPLIALTISGFINVILNIFFVVVMHMTAEGVALATVISNTVSALLLLKALLDSDSIISIRMSEMKIDIPVLKEILKIGVPAGIQSAVFSFANIIIQSAINSLGSIVMAASSAAFNIETFAYYVMNAFGQACTTFTGRFNGAGKPEKCTRVLWICLIQDAIATALIITIILISGKEILALFNPDSEVIEIGYVRLQIIFFAYTFSFINEVVSGYLRGFGISLITALLTTISICGSRLFWIFVIFPLNPVFIMIMYIYPISLGLNALCTLIAAIVIKPSYKRKKALQSI